MPALERAEMRRPDAELSVAEKNALQARLIMASGMEPAAWVQEYAERFHMLTSASPTLRQALRENTLTVAEIQKLLE